MSQKLYIVRLIFPFRSDPSNSDRKAMLSLRTKGAFTTRAAAEEFARTNIPTINPFMVFKVYHEEHGFRIYRGGWNEKPDVYFVSYHALNKAIVNIGMQPPIFIAPSIAIMSPKTSPFWSIIFLASLLWMMIRGQNDLSMAITVSLGVILLLTFRTMPMGFDTTKKNQKWAEWWEENASTMTDQQKRTIWELLANGGPYEIVEIERED
jgi:hypothetical protein